MQANLLPTRGVHGMRASWTLLRERDIFRVTLLAILTCEVAPAPRFMESRARGRPSDE